MNRRGFLQLMSIVPRFDTIVLPGTAATSQSALVEHLPVLDAVTYAHVSECADWVDSFFACNPLTRELIKRNLK